MMTELVTIAYVLAGCTLFAGAYIAGETWQRRINAQRVAREYLRRCFEPKRTPFDDAPFAPNERRRTGPCL